MSPATTTAPIHACPFAAPAVLSQHKTRLCFPRIHTHMVRSKPWPVFCMEQVAEHNHKDDCWIVVDDKVYDMTPHVRNHEGWIGSGKISTLLAILSCMGTDCTEDFNATHDSRGFKELHAFQVPGDACFPLFPEMRALSILAPKTTTTFLCLLFPMRRLAFWTSPTLPEGPFSTRHGSSSSHLGASRTAQVLARRPNPWRRRRRAAARAAQEATQRSALLERLRHEARARQRPPQQDGRRRRVSSATVALAWTDAPSKQGRDRFN